jgi:DNA-binding NarL/FixJ family response regulator
MLVDDHEILRQGLRVLLQAEENIEVIGDAGSGEALLKAIDNGVQPDVILIDISLGGMSGIEATKLVRQRLPNTRVIGLTVSTEESMILEMLQAGACSYLLKTMSSAELVRAIRTASGNGLWLPLDIQHRLQRHLGHRRSFPPPFPVKTPGADLTRREKDVVQKLLEGFSNKEIARRLYISERTVQTHLSNIFGKMNVASRTEAVLVAMRDGWLMNH